MTDISLRAVAGAVYPLFHADFKVDATGAQLGDGVDANDKSFRTTFPYLALPHDGFNSVPHFRFVAPATGGRDLTLWWFLGAGMAAAMAGSMLLVLRRVRRPSKA